MFKIVDINILEGRGGWLDGGLLGTNLSQIFRTNYSSWTEPG